MSDKAKIKSLCEAFVYIGERIREAADKAWDHSAQTHSTVALNELLALRELHQLELFNEAIENMENMDD